MNSRYRSPLTLIGAAILTAMAGAPAVLADDTEIYDGQPTTAAEGRPNILFILDTSGSMNGQVVTQEPYNPGETYEGNCPANRIYWKSSTSGIDDVPVNRNCILRGRDRDNPTGWVTASVFHCRTAANAIAVSGFRPVTRTAQWRPRNPVANSRWTTLRRDTTTDPVECADDSDPAKMNPPHGDGNRAYAGNGTSGPFTNDVAQQISWETGDTSGTYTYYSSNYLNWYYNARVVTKSRMEIVQESLNGTLGNLTQANVGLMRFDTHGEGGMVLHEIAEIGSARDSIRTQVNAIFPTGTTPLSETYYEAALYWRGAPWDYGSRSSPVTSVRSSRRPDNAGVYLSPSNSSCQKNFVVILSDGEPVNDASAESRILSLPGFRETVGTACSVHVGTGNTSGRCLDDMAEYMFRADMNPDEPGIQNVITYTVGFGSDVQNVNWAVQLLRDTAQRGGGAFFQAGDTATLTEVFTNIIQEILAVNTTFTAPTVAVNAFNRTQNLSDLYISVFGTSGKFHWPGNVKKYEVQPDGTITDRDGQPAVDPSTGFFLNSARSFWSNVTDGSDVTLGGAAHQLPDPTLRNVHTDISGALLTTGGNAVTTANALLTDDILGTDPADPGITRADLIRWIRGADINAADPADRGNPRYVMGDPLHARPATVIYGGTAENPDMVLYATTNDGYLHAIDSSTGQELWSYVPGHLLRRMKDLYEDANQASKRYALDGNLQAFKIDYNNNGIVDGNDRVYLYFGMGRGGQSYFALDVTDKTRPRLMWRRGGALETTADGSLLPASAQLPGLGQTWSSPVITRVRISGATQNAGRLVAVFAGGYDPTQDNVDYNTDDIGNRLYMVDAETGDLLWRAGPTGDAGANLRLAGMTNSIPADIRVIDLDNDGFADRMYAADTGGRIFRFDVFNGNSPENLVTGGVFASLGSAAGTSGSSPADARRFYSAPDVALLRTPGRAFFNLAIGSGFRGHPLDTSIRDRFYSLRDYEPYVKKTQSQYDAFEVIRDDSPNLIDVTANITPPLPSSALGWKIDLRLPAWQGEKVLSEAVTFDNQILFTTYLPEAGDPVPGSNSCVARQGGNRLYVVNALDGSPVTNRDGSTGPDGQPSEMPESPTDRWSDLAQSGIAPEAVILFPGTSTPACIVGVEQCGIGLTNDPVKTIWRQPGVDLN